MSTHKSGIQFKEPPERREQRYDWAAIAEDLRSRPGEWALIFEQDRTSLVTSFRLGGYKDLPVEEFEYMTNHNTREFYDEDGEYHPRMCSMWLRYNPAKERA